MSFIQSTITCEDCEYEMNVVFGVVRMTQIGGWPKECPKCKGEKLKKINEGWSANNDNWHPKKGNKVWK